ncbi:hypothetical protein [Sorangium sp. So ce1151]|uniref:hypothetical protein n=1 Tax=Sorangium sp. So ce1151 TaxID=3133332 RepID=UPI003F607D5C
MVSNAFILPSSVVARVASPTLVIVQLRLQRRAGPVPDEGDRLSPGLSESIRTLDLLAEAGIEYVANWVNDEQPYPMRVKSGSVLSLPYSLELNDFAAFLERGQTGEAFAQTICDQFDVLYEDGAGSGRVMAICLHPFLIGHPHRSKHLARALAHIASRREVWLTTGGEIADLYNRNYRKR